jgi:hypothetical protein
LPNTRSPARVSGTVWTEGMRGKRLAAVSMAMALALVASAQAGVPITEVISDPYTNPSSQHATAVEPDTFAWGPTDTIVVTSQVGRFFNGGASNTGWATSTDNGQTWTEGVLPGITTFEGGPYDRASDPTVAYDPEHDVWMISSLAINEVAGGGIDVPRVVISRSTDGGLTWSGPVNVPAPPGGDLDKNWTTCDTTATSPFFGNCYTTFDDVADFGRLYMSTSTDGGQTWGTPKKTANNATGLGGVPVVRPNGTVIVPAINSFASRVIAFKSTDGGQTWSNTVSVSNIQEHVVAGDLRTLPLPSAEVDAGGRVFVVWQDCRFRTNCRSNDLVMSTSKNGVDWTPVARIPIDPTGSLVDHFIPGVDVVRKGSTARIGLTYYFYENTQCGRRGGSCELEVGYIQSNNRGQTWSAPIHVAGPFPVSWTPDTTLGRMVADYISTSWLAGRAWGAFAVATSPPTPFDQSIYVPTGGLKAPAGSFGRSSEGQSPVATAPHGPRHIVRRR